MKPILLVLLAVMTGVSLVFSQSEVPTIPFRDFLPEGHMENIPLADSSIQQCYIFRTTAGVRYTVESSTDLTNWTPQDEIYGLGNEYVVTMREYTPPPPPPPGTPPVIRPAPAINASIRLQRASGPEGGIVVAWPSHDHGGPIVVRIAGEMDPGWNQIPLFSNRFGGYYFFIWHPWYVAALPLSDSILGPKDTALLAALEASLPAMNQQVADSIVLSRNAPLPGPELPGSKRFWRVKVDPDVDTDSDGSPDWAEFEIFTRGTGMLASGVIGEAFNADTNSDGIPDGQQLDTDGDGTPDAFDPDPNDNATFVPIGPEPRYALFEIPGNAIQINDLGTVILSEKVWKNGTLSNLQGGGVTAPLASASGINDLDVILGTANRDSNGTDFPASLTGKICYWSSPTANYQTLQVVEGGQTVVAFCHHDARCEQGPAPIISTTGRFIGEGYVENPPPDYRDDFEGASTLWSIPASGSSSSRTASPSGSIYLSGSTFGTELIWGHTRPIDLERPGTIHGSGAIPPLPFVPYNVIALPLPKGGEIYFASSKPAELFDDNDETPATVVYQAGSWQPNKTYATAIDIARDDTAVGRNQPGKTAPILLNGIWTGIEKTVPGVPAAWRDPSIKLVDTTSNGWILGRDTIHSNSAALLPIKVDGVDPDVVPPPLPPAPGTPPFNPPEFLAGGVDHTSMTAIGGNGRVPQIWIMAPNGGAANTVRFQSPLNLNSNLKLTSNSQVNFSPDVVESKDTQIHVRGEVQNTVDNSPTLKLGSKQDALNTPLKVKAMKRRTVKLAVHKVFGLDEHGNPTTPANFPSKADLEVALNKVYGKQVNTFFDATMYDEKGPAQTGIDFDFAVDNNDRKLKVRPLTDPELLAATPNAKAEGDAATANIDIWVIGGGVTLVLDGKPVYGSHCGEAGVGKVIIDGNLTGYSGTAEENAKLMMHVFAHEIGHVMMTDDHPDEEIGSAKLKWKYTDSLTVDARDKERLMCSGDNSNFSNPGKQLIKREWDLIEDWLKNEELQNRMNP